MALPCEIVHPTNPVDIVSLQPITPAERLISGVENSRLDEVCRALVEGADPNAQVRGQNALHLACEKGNADIVSALLDYMTDLNAPSEVWNFPPLHTACFCGKKEVVSLLINRGVPLNTRFGSCQMTPLELSIVLRHPDCSRLLIEAGAEVACVNQFFGSWSLELACSQGDVDTVGLLLDHHADPNQCVNKLPLCAALHSPKVVSLLLEHEAKTLCCNSATLSGGEAGFTPLKSAVFLGHAESLEILLKTTANRHELSASIVKELLAFAQERLKSHQELLHAYPSIPPFLIGRYRAVIEVLSKTLAEIG